MVLGSTRNRIRLYPRLPQRRTSSRRSYPNFPQRVCFKGNPFSCGTRHATDRVRLPLIQCPDPLSTPSVTKKPKKSSRTKVGVRNENPSRPFFHNPSTPLTCERKFSVVQSHSPLNKFSRWITIGFKESMLGNFLSPHSANFQTIPSQVYPTILGPPG